MSRPSPLLEMRGIQKSFGVVRALDGVDFELSSGSVHALVGENGAGKSTLIKVMTGAYTPDAGSMRLAGEPLALASPQAGQRRGVVAVHQEIQLLMHASVAENVLLGREPRRWGFIDWAGMHSRTQALLAELGLDIDPRAILEDLPISLRQMVAIARGASLRPSVLVLDEPTSSLPADKVALLYAVIRRLRDGGTGIVYISHRFDELDAVCDSVTVLRDGKRVLSRPLVGLSRLELVSEMLGKPLADVASTKPSAAVRESLEAGPRIPALSLQRLRAGNVLRQVSFDAHRGEVLGLAGLLGSGRSETVRAVFGADPWDDGAILADGQRFEPRSPRAAIEAGLALLPEDRAQDGVLAELSVRENVTLAVLPRLSRFGFIRRARERALVGELVQKLRIKAASLEQKLGELSGGNQQKVLLARWLVRQPQVLLLDDPTRGIDVGAKAEIHALIRELAASGLCVVLISSEIEELVSNCSRVIVLREGRSVAELRDDDVNAASIVRAMAGSLAREDGQESAERS